QVNKEVVNPRHPFAKFSVGNLQTLGDRDGVSIRQEIVDFYQSTYSADLMTLTLYGPQSLDEQQAWVEEMFCAIVNRHLHGKSIDEPISDENSTAITVRVEPIKEIRKLVLTFPLPGMDQYYSIKPLS